MNLPIGFRAAQAAVRDARLNLQRSYLSLRTEEEKAERYLALPYRQILEFLQQIQVNQAALRAVTGQLEGYFDLFRQGRAAGSDANLSLALQNFSNSVASYYAAIVQYNNALATFEFAKGAIMERDKVFISEGPLPHCAQIRAVEHERQRTRALVLRDQSITPVSCSAEPALEMPKAPADRALSLPLLQRRQPLVAEMDPDPKPKTESP